MYIKAIFSTHTQKAELKEKMIFIVTSAQDYPNVMKW